MVVSIADLDCLDLVIWLRTCENASSRLAISQPSISRALKRAASSLDITITKVGGEWQVEGDPTILSLERRIHQHPAL